MRLAAGGRRVAVFGASSLLGRELLAVLEERRFPVSHLVKQESHDEAADLPIVDLGEESEPAVAADQVSAEDLDFVFIAARPASGRDLPALAKLNGAAPCVVIDLVQALDATGEILSVPFLETDGRRAAPGSPNDARRFASPHAATILISSLLLRLAARFELRRAVAQVFEPVSEIGPRAIEELQKQTVSLLSFQKIPQDVFGAQLAFNLLPRLKSASPRAAGGVGPGDLEPRLRLELRNYFGGRISLPALRVFHVPVFYSLAVSCYVETARREPADAITQALAGPPVAVRRPSKPAPSQVDAVGSADILVDNVIPDADTTGAWIWAVADNMRLAASNAVQIAERLNQSAE